MNRYRTFYGFLWGLSAPVLLPACTEVVDSSGRAAIDVKETAIYTTEKVKDYFTYRIPAKKEPPPLEPRYCYKTLQDIICYKEPYAPLENRLSGVQGAAVPKQAITEVVMANQSTASALEPRSGSVKEPDARPLFIEPLPPVKEDAQGTKIVEPVGNKSLF